jgi:hypothetical protein
MTDKPRQHQWVQMVLCPVDVISDLDGKPMVSVDERKWAEAENEPLVSCFACGIIVEEGYDTNCPGSMDPLHPVTEEDQ